MEEDSEVADRESWTAEVHFTNANYQSKKMIFLLFINRLSLSVCVDVEMPIDLQFPDRLVESSRMKRVLEAVYSGVLPKGASPFIYLR
jgi:DNA mismatch repair protein MLH1